MLDKYLFYGIIAIGRGAAVACSTTANMRIAVKYLGIAALALLALVCLVLALSPGLMLLARAVMIAAGGMVMSAMTILIGRTQNDELLEKRGWVSALACTVIFALCIVLLATR